MWRHYLDSLFPIKIERTPDMLVIEDRRPSDSLLLSVVFTVLAVCFSAMLLQPLISTGTYWLLGLFILPIPTFGVRSLLMPFREKYVFDKNQDRYLLIRHSLLKRHNTEGDLSPIRAIQIERRTVSSENQTSEVFQIVLLQRQGLLLGASDSMVLREKMGISSYFENEARIAYAIADFLGLSVPEIVNM